MGNNMKMTDLNIAQRLRIAGILIVLGLVVELLTLAWNNPISFIVFLGAGGLMMFLGIVIYLWSLVSEDQKTATLQGQAHTTSS
jgi:predicted membrane channel-forming protein YqfA (hemolysin III family)